MRTLKQTKFGVNINDKNPKKIGAEVKNWVEAKRPHRKVIKGIYCDIVPFNLEQHADDLFEAYSQDKEGINWTYMRYGPFSSETEFREWALKTCLADDPLFFVVISKKTQRAMGLFSYLNINEKFGTIEIGHLNYSPNLQRTVAATEAMFLMMKNAFENLGYRRYQWQCDDLNTASRNAALRLGFRFEGVLRQATMYKNRNRDSAFFSIIDKEWPLLKIAFETWLDKSNFEPSGEQRINLLSIINELKDQFK